MNHKCLTFLIMALNRNQSQRTFAAIVRATDPIEINDFGYFTLSKQYCLNAIDTVEAFYDELFPLLVQRIE